MSIIRLIHIRIDPSETENAVLVWKAECAPLMIQQQGCMSEKLLRCKDAPEFISYSEWESEAAIEAYRNSEAHNEIVQHARALKDAKAEVDFGPRETGMPSYRILRNSKPVSRREECDQC